MAVMDGKMRARHMPEKTPQSKLHLVVAGRRQQGLLRVMEEPKCRFPVLRNG
jgi:hypothetical protein